jgi:hypothetical protein
MRQIEFIHEHLGGYPGPIVAFLHWVDYYLRTHNRLIDENFLHAVYTIFELDREMAVKHAHRTSNTLHIGRAKSSTEVSNKKGRLH